MEFGPGIGILLGYLDPGTGSLVVQALVAGLMAAVVAFRTTRAYVLSFFRRLIGKAKGPDEAPRRGEGGRAHAERNDDAPGR